MNKAKFFDGIRPAFRGRFNQSQVDGMEAILDACEREDVNDLHWGAHILAHVRRETGGIMAPIKETVQARHKNKNPSDAEVIRRLDRAFARGQLTWVSKPYWRKGMFGRDQIQITHEDNYRKMGRVLGVNFVANPDAVMEPENSARIAVIGMSRGMFTGKKLSDYSFPKDLRNPPRSHPRRIVNGQDGSDAQVSRYHRQFYDALIAAGA